jgi:hypothetical protein
MTTTPPQVNSRGKKIYGNHNRRDTIHYEMTASLLQDHTHLKIPLLRLLEDQYLLETLRRQGSKMSTRCNAHQEAHRAELEAEIHCLLATEIYIRQVLDRTIR